MTAQRASGLHGFSPILCHAIRTSRHPSGSECSARHSLLHGLAKPGVWPVLGHRSPQGRSLILICTDTVRILVSSTRKPISYINLAKRFLQEHGEMRITALGIAVAPAVTVAEILKNRGLATEKQIYTALESVGGVARARHKPKIDILLVKSEQFDDIIAAENPPAPDNPDAPSSSAAVHSSVPSSSAAVHSSVPSSSGVVRSSVLSSPAAVHSSEQDEQAQEDKTAPALDAAPASVGDMHTSSESVHTEVPPVLT